ncbi:hypothetical protein PVAND_001568 [Polypedilum vanderplanki]|uniref:Cytochrome P450 n=1 Tax=Polypedilum vanderplanki TaxID=319348 RepID=A0A9J6BNS7_POLVA|nr:hypothetical protein PVAND_001568 [Polypedilum vanderplanki]
MWFFDILILSFCYGFIYYFWKLISYYLQIFKIPKSSFNGSLEKVLKFINGDTKFLFEQVFSSLKVNGLTRSWVGPFVFINIIHPEDMKIIFTSKNCLDKPNFVKKYLKLRNGLVFGDIKPWKSHRKILNYHFGLQSVQSMIPMFNKKVKILIDNFEKMVGKKEFDIFYFVAAATLDNILTLMGLDLDIQNKDEKQRDVFIQDVKCYTEIVLLRVMKIWLYFDFFFDRSYLGKKHKEAKSSIGDKLVKNVMKNIQEIPKSEKNFIQALMDPKYNLKDTEIYDEIFTIIIAAQDTSAVALSNVLLLLAMHKNVQNKVFDELRKIIGNEIDYLDLEKLNELDYLEMVINEAMRILPVIPLFFKKNETNLTTNEGYTIPAGSNLFISVYSMHRSKNVWGEDAETFKPERFEKENFEKIHPYAFIPFSKGSRMCLGYRYAMALMKIQLANIIMKYEVDTSLKLDELEFKLNVTLNIVQGHMISLNKRDL